MKVSPQEYNSLLNRLIDPNEFIHMLRIPEDEPIYEDRLTVAMAQRTPAENQLKEMQSAMMALAGVEV